MAEETKLNQSENTQEQTYDEVLNSMSIEQKDNTIKQLDRQCAMLAQENIKLKQQMQVMQQSDFYKMLDWNYKIATDRSGAFHSKFMDACAKRIEEAMTPVENLKKEENNG